MRKTGTVIDCLPDANFKIDFGDGSKILRTYISGKMRKYKIAVLLNDRVEVEVPDIGEIGRIVKRL